MTVEEYLADIHISLVENPVVAHYVVVHQRASSQSGYLRVRIRLCNGDFLESAEFFRLKPDGIEVVDYRHQWMDENRTVLKKRWDSAPHHPELENAPYHCHHGEEDIVMPDQLVGIQGVLQAIAYELGNR